MFADPDKILKQLALHEDSLVADLGAGTGFYSIAAAKIVRRGKVYAVEVLKDYLPTIRAKAAEQHLNNIETIWGDIEKKEGSKIRTGLVDAVILSNVLSQVDDRENLLRESTRILKSGGKILLIDWSELAPGSQAGRAVSKDKAGALLSKYGCKWYQEVDAGAHHYGMIFIKEGRE